MEYTNDYKQDSFIIDKTEHKFLQSYYKFSQEKL